MSRRSHRRLLLPSIRRWGAIFGIINLLSTFYLPSLALAAGVYPVRSQQGSSAKKKTSNTSAAAAKRCKKGYASKAVKKKVKVKKGNQTVWVTKTVIICVKDAVRPTKVTGLEATLDGTDLELTWDESSDNFEVIGYQLYRNKKSLGKVEDTEYSDSGLENGTTYTYKVVALDQAGNRSRASKITVTPGNQLGSDSQAPTAPTDVNAVAGDGEVSITWTAATDNVGVVGYRITRDGEEVAVVEETSYVDSGLENGKTYTYEITALDDSGNASEPQSFSISPELSSESDSTPPTTPQGLAANVYGDTVTLNWNSSTDDLGVTKYNVYRASNALDYELVGTSPGEYYSDNELAPGTYTYKVTAVDQAENESEESTEATAVVSLDTDPPSVPDGVAVSVSGDTATVRWNASTDEFGVAGYNIYRATTGMPYENIGTSTTTSYADQGLPADTYYYKISAFDEAGHESGRSSVAYGKIAPDDKPPSVPTNLRASAKIDSVELTWTASTDNTAVESYNIYRSAAGGGYELVDNSTTNSYTDSGLELGTYSYKVSAVDDTGLESAQSSAASATLAPDTTAPSVPSGVKAVSSGNNVTITWNASTDAVGVDYYNVYTLTAGGGYELIDTSSTTSYTDTGVATGAHSYKISAVDTSGNESAQSLAASTSAADGTAPSVPAGVAARASGSSAAVSWTASTDNVGVSAYYVYRASGATATYTYIGKSVTTSYTDQNLRPGTYYYKVSAIDAAQNESAQSKSATVTISDTTPPTAPTGLTATAATASVGLKWTGSTDNIGVAGYNIYRAPSGTTSYTKIGSATTLSYTDTSVKPGVYTYKVSAVDAAGNESPQSAASSSVTILDKTAPTVPTGLVATALASGVSLTWAASTDNVAVSYYSVYRLNPTTNSYGYIGKSVTPSYTDNGLNAGTYSYKVTAVDAAQNASAQSSAASATIEAAADTTPPSVPAGLKAAADVDSVTLTWTASTDISGVDYYNIYRSLPGTAYELLDSSLTTSYTDGGLLPDAYSYKVTAVDLAGNESAQSSSASATVTSNVDDVAPSTPAGIKAVLSGDSVTVTWNVATDNVGVESYNIYRATTGTGYELWDASVTNSYTDSGLYPDTYSYKVTAVDAAGNESAQSDSASATVLTPDQGAPTQPAPISTYVKAGIVTLSWGASTDDVAVTGYRISRAVSSPSPSWQTIASSGATATYYYDRSLADGTYLYKVTAVDAAGNQSQPSDIVTAVIDTTPPSVPTGVTASSVGNGISINWLASTDKGGTVTSYNIYRAGTGTTYTKIASSVGTSYTDIGAPTGTYYYKVTAVDASNNESAQSAAATAVAADTTPPTIIDGIAVKSIAGDTVTLGWPAASDNVAVTGYKIYRSAGLFSSLTWVGSSTTTSYTDTPATPGTYSYHFSALDAAGNESRLSLSVQVTVADVRAPSPPGNLAASVSGTTATLTWTAATDNLAVNGYRVYRSRNGATPVRVGTSASLSYIDIALEAGSYSYTVTAVDAAGNESTPAGPAKVSVADTTAPTAPGTINYNVTATSGCIALAWGGSSDNVGVTGYKLYRYQWEPVRQAAVLLNATTKTYTDCGLSPGTYSYEVLAVDAAGNQSPITKGALVTMPDVNPPSVPTGVQAVVSSGNIAVSWNASTDNVAVAGYEVWREVVGGAAGPVYFGKTTTSTSFNDVDALPGVTYAYRILAFDASQNRSVLSASSANATGPDNIAPSSPGVQGSAARDGSGCVDLFWSASTDNIGVVGYNIYRNSAQVGTSTSTKYAECGRAPGSYTYSVRARDAAGNLSAEVTSSTAVIVVPDLTAPSVPTGLSAAASGRAINLTWNPSTDNVGISSYQVWRMAPGATSFTYLADTAGATSYSDTNVESGLIYSYQVRAYDKVENFSAFSSPYSVRAPDVTPPSTPTGFYANVLLDGSGCVALGWNASVDNVFVTGYRLYRGSTLVDTTTLRNYTQCGLDMGSYSYSVSAIDAAGNESTKAVTYVKVPDTIAPTAPGTPLVTLGKGSVDVAWPTSTDAVGVTGYQVYRATPGAAYTLYGRASTNYFVDLEALPGNTYYYKIAALDAAGNLSAQSTGTSFVVPLDTTAPGTPTNLTATLSGYDVTLSWGASDDNWRLAGYKVNGTTTGATSYTITNVRPGTHTFTVSAYDTSNNNSAAASVTVVVPDITAPTTINGLSATWVRATNPTTFVSSWQPALSWGAANDNVVIVAYRVYRACEYGINCPVFLGSGLNWALMDTVKPSTVNSNSWIDWKFPKSDQNATYYYTVRAVDAAGNEAPLEYQQGWTYSTLPPNSQCFLARYC